MMKTHNARVCGFLCALLILFTACADRTAHTPVNSLPRALPVCAVFQNGAVYFLKNGVLSLAAENVYDPAEGALSADYAADAERETLLFCRDQTLLLAQNGVCETVGANVKTWRASVGFETVVFATPWREARDDELGALFCRKNGVLRPLDEGVLLSSLMLSADGSVLYARKPNIYPKTGTRLIRYDTATSEAREMLSDCEAVFWISGDGDAVITAEKSAEDTYDYTIHTTSFSKSLTETDGYLPSVTADGRYLYLLCRYRNGAGELDRVDLSTLECRTLARDVAFFSCDAVTDPSKGVVYSVRTKENVYSFYYARENGSAVRLMRQAPAQALTGIALDSRREVGYLLAPGAARQDTALWRITLAGEDVNAVRLMTGDLSSPVYFEEEDVLLCLKDAAQSGGTLVRASGEQAEMLFDCAALDGQALCVLSRNALLYLTELSSDATGTLMCGRTRLAQNVPASELLAPVACRGFGALYYLAADENGTYTLHYHTDGQSVPLADEVQGLASLYEGG